MNDIIYEYFAKNLETIDKKQSEDELPLSWWGPFSWRPRSWKG